MAQRPVFIPQASGPRLVKSVMLDFQWHAGLSVSQKQKSIQSLHAAAQESLGLTAILEVSSKSGLQLGVRLSAFNLQVWHPSLENLVSLECAFQAAKVFTNGGPFLDLLQGTSLNAKRDARLKNSGDLTAFKFGTEAWPLEPKTLFYDWLYLNALFDNADRFENIRSYEGFTDIEFNPQVSINCQAYSAALYVALSQRGIMEAALESPQRFKQCICQFSAEVEPETKLDNAQGSSNQMPLL